MQFIKTKREDMINKIKVSVIIPAYNVEIFIERCIKSVLNQTLKEIEIIAVNDGSIDRTGVILEKLKLKDKRLKVIHKENGGLSSARNEGLKICTGEYICHLDGDDWIEKDAYYTMYKFATEKKLDIVVTDYFDDYENKKIYKKDFCYKSIIVNNEIYLKEYFKGNGVPAIWSKMYKKELYNEIFHPENISIGEDATTLPKLILKAQKIGKINKAFVHYINNLESMSRDKMSLKLNELKMTFDEIEFYFKEEQRYNEFKEYIIKNKIKHFSNFIYYTPYWKNAEYQKNLEYINNFFFQMELKILKSTLTGFKKNYYILQKYTKSKILEKIVINCIFTIKKLRREYLIKLSKGENKKKI